MNCSVNLIIDIKKARITTEQRQWLQPSKGTDYKSAPAESDHYLCELDEAKSAPALYYDICDSPVICG